MKFAGEKAESFAKRPKPDIWAALVYCEDEGVANDAASTLARKWAGKDPDAQTISLDEDAVRKEPSDFFDALEARSLLGSARTLRLHTSGDKLAKLIGEALAAESAKPGRFEAKLIVTAGSLQRKSKLRTAFENEDRAAALQLFADELGDVSDLIRSALGAESIEIDPDALDALASGLPGHRRIIHSEIDKLVLYAKGLGRALTVDDIRAVTIPAIDARADAYVDAVFDRRLDDALSELDRLLLTGSSVITLIRALQRETQKLLAVSALGPNASADAGMKMRPPVFKSQWPQAIRRVKAWPATHLARILERIYDLEHQAKLAGPISNVTHQAFTLQLARPHEAAR